MRNVVVKHTQLLWALVNLGVALFGILFLGWGIRPVIFLFWIEIILTVGVMSVRTLFALDGGSFWANLPGRLFVAVAATVLGLGVILLSVVLTFQGLSGPDDRAGFGGQILALILNYAGLLLGGYFLNGAYKVAQPMAQIMPAFIRLIFLLSVLLVLQQKILPLFEEADGPVLVATAVLVLKFAADWLLPRFVAKAMSDKVAADA